MMRSAWSHRAWLVWRRNLDVHRATWKVNLLPPLLEPILFLLAFGFGLGRHLEEIPWQGAEIGYLEFVAGGIMAIAVMHQAFFECSFSSFVRMYYQRTFDAIIATPLTIEDVVTGELLWGATKGGIAATVMLLPISAFGVTRWPSALLLIPLGFLGGLVFACLAMLATALVPTIDTFNLPLFLMITPMMLFSGTFFPLELLPAWAQLAAEPLPLTHLTRLIRAALLGLPDPRWAMSLAWLILYLVPGAWLSIRLMKRRLVR